MTVLTLQGARVSEGTCSSASVLLVSSSPSEWQSPPRPLNTEPAAATRSP